MRCPESQVQPELPGGSDSAGLALEHWAGGGEREERRMGLGGAGLEWQGETERWGTDSSLAPPLPQGKEAL